MKLLGVSVAGLPPLDGATLDARDDAGLPRDRLVVFGAPGTGKSTLLAAVGDTRPGHAVPAALGRRRDAEAPPTVVTRWALGDDDPTRPHPLVVASPTATLPGETADEAAARRREQALFDRRAAEGGFVVVAFSGARWFSRHPTTLTSPERALFRHDPRAATGFDDPSRADLARDVKATLAYAGLARALVTSPGERARLEDFERSVTSALEAVLAPFDGAFVGTSARALEPELALGGERTTFDDLPRGAKHLVALVALTLRALAGAYPSSPRSVRVREAVVLVDDVELGQDARLAPALPGLLEAALPRVQWLLTTSAPAVADAAGGGVVLRRETPSAPVVVHAGELARLH